MRSAHEEFWELRNYIGDPEIPLSVPHILQWSQHTYRVMQRFERDFMFAMDRAFRHARAEVLKFHEARPQVDLEDRDRKRS